MKKVVLNVIAAVLMTVGLGGVAMISPAYAADDGTNNIKDCVGKVDCDAIKGDSEGVFGKNDLMGTLTTIINVIVGMVGFVAVAMIVMGTIWKIKKKDWAGLEKYICEIEEMCKVQIAREKNVINQLLILMDRLACLYSKDEADELALFMYRPDKERKYHYKKEWYAESVRMPFENITIPVPTGYRDILRVLYGEDYMVPQHWKRD